MKKQSLSSLPLYNGDSDSDHESSFNQFSKIEIKNRIKALAKSDAAYISSSILMNISQSMLESSYVQYNELKKEIHKKIVSDIEGITYTDKFTGWKKYIPGLYLFSGKVRNQEELKDQLAEYFNKYSKEIETYIKEELRELSDLRHAYYRDQRKHLKDIKQFLQNDEDHECDKDTIQILGFKNKDELKNALVNKIRIKYFKNITFEEVENVVFGYNESDKKINKEKIKPLVIFKDLLDKKIPHVTSSSEIMEIILDSGFISEFYSNGLSKTQKIDNDIDNILHPSVKKQKLALEEEGEYSDKLSTKESKYNFSKEIIKDYIKAEDEYIGIYSVKLILENEESNIKEINDRNKIIGSKLKSFLSKKAFQEDFHNHVAESLIDQKIVRNELKKSGISKIKDTMLYNKELLSGVNNAIGSTEISINGTKTDYRYLPLIQDSSAYIALTNELKQHLNNIQEKSLIKIFRQIIRGKEVDYTNIDSKDFIYRFTDLLFNCETERNVSAFLTNAMFMELVTAGVYTIDDLPNRLPMAIKKDEDKTSGPGAVAGARYMLDLLGGKYGIPAKYLIKRQYYDFGEGDENKAKELAARDTVLFLDWLVSKRILNKEDLIKYIDSNNKEQNIDLIEASSRIYNFYDTLTKQSTNVYAKNTLPKIIDAINTYLANVIANEKSVIFKALYDLVNEWYGIKLDYLLVKLSEEDIEMNIEFDIDSSKTQGDKDKIKDISTNTKASTTIEDKAKKLIKENAAGDDRNLADHGDNAHYWYSIADGVRLLSWLRKQYITYTNTVNKEEEYIAYRENNNRVFITDPYYAGNFDNYFRDDVSRITEGKIGESTFLDKKWTSMPTAIIIPLLSGLHWRTVCIAIDYDNRTAKIFLDDPYGIGRFPENLKNNVVEAIKTNIEKLIQKETTDPTFKLITDIPVKEKQDDQQGSGENGWDCGPITFSNIGDYIYSITKSTELAYSIAPYKGRNENIIINVRARDIEHYSEIASLPINQERVAQIKEQLQKSRQAEIDKIKKVNETVDYDGLDSLYVDMLFKVLENTRILGISAEIGEYTKSEITDAYQVVLMEISNFTNFKSKNVINKLKSSKVDNIFKEFQNLSEKEQKELLEKINNTALKGLDKKEDSDIDWINSYFGKYTIDGFDNILNLRLNDLKLKDIKTLKGIFVDQEHNNITELLSSVVNTKAPTTLVPLSLFNKHAAGLIFEKTNDLIQVKYLDPENKPIPLQLEQLFKNHNLSVVQLKVEQQKYANCSVEVIEDFIFYLTNERLSQEQAIPYHSYLLEQSLLCDNYEEMPLVGCGL